MIAWKLIGVVIVVVGFALRLNPLLVVLVAGVATGLVAGISVWEVLGMGSVHAALGMYVFSAVFCPCHEMLGLKSKLLSSAITSPGFKESSSNFSSNLDRICNRGVAIHSSSGAIR